jgi:hypothetical protein
MAVTNLYRTLFKLELLHHYFLDEGTSVYDSPLDPNNASDLEEIVKHQKNRRKHQLSDFFKITPTERTVRILKNWKATYRIQGDGILVGIKAYSDGASPNPKASVNPFIPFDDKFIMDFTIEIVDPLFENYTDTVINRNKLVMISNRIPATIVPPVVEGDPVPVSVEFSKLSEYAVETPGAALEVDLLKDISPNELQGKFGLIRMHLQGEDANETSLVNQSDATIMASDTPTPKVLLKNRQTNWHYYSNEDRTLIFPVTNNQTKLRPLTQNGYVKIANGPPKRYPNPDAKLIILDNGEYYSEVYL